MFQGKRKETNPFKIGFVSLGGPGENRTLVQTSREWAFYMLSRLLFVGKNQANLQAELIRSY